MTRLDALAPHRRTVADMLGYKMHPEHIHLQVRGVARISRTVPWWREVALAERGGGLLGDVRFACPTSP